MHSGQLLPAVPSGTLLSDALLEMSRKGLGMTCITADDGTLAGLFTDGDLRRALDQDVNVKTTVIDKVMSAKCKTVTPHMLAVEALKLMEDNSINGVIVVDSNNKPIGALNMHDLLKAGVM